MKKNIFRLVLLLVFSVNGLFAATFDELDKAPEGAHKGQMLLGCFVSIGGVLGGIIDAENTFLEPNVYELDSGTWKKLQVSHLSFDLGISFEYMPFDYVGARTKIKRTVLIQRTIFGSQYENWSETLYSSIAFCLGPAFHLTSRKQWDITLTPVAGYTLADFYATPVAAKLLEGYSGDRERSVNGFTCGTELSFTAYFSGGLFLSLGFDWNMYFLSFKAFNLTDPHPDHTNNKYFPGETSSNIHTLSCIISAGYAFSN